MFFLMTSLYCCLAITVAAKPTVTILNFVIGEGSDPFSCKRSCGSIDMAVEKVTSSLSDYVEIKYVRQVYPPPCDANHVGAMMAETHHRHNITVMIGPACSLAVDVVARMAASWNIPVISPLATNSLLGDKDNFPTLTRLYYNMNNWARTYLALFRIYDWSDIAIIHEYSHALHLVVGTSLETEFDLAHIKTYRQSFISNQPYDMKKILRRASERSRVFLLSMWLDDLRPTMLMARELGMTAGEYVFIYHRVLGDTNLLWQAEDGMDEAAQKAFGAVLITQLRRPDSPEFMDFETEVKRRSLVDYNYTYSDEMTLSVANFHDSFMVYAQALRETLTLGEDYNDGRLMSSKIWGRNFTGVSGAISIDSNGDREMDFSLLDLDMTTGQYKVVANYYGLIHGFVFENASWIQWPNSRGPPPNVPRCGFLGDNPVCKATGLSTEVTIVIIFCVTTVMFTLSTLIIYRKFKMESDLNSQWWKVRWSEVDRVGGLGRTMSSLSNCRMVTRQDSRGRMSATDTVHNANLVVYKGNTVHASPLNMKTVKIDRATLVQLKQMRDIQCANLARFHGLCPEPPDICLLTEHCTRGSLQDMLHNTEIKLDPDFKLSLLNDIIQGIYYIHTSILGYHGRLNSGKCLIDSRFVLKITDYGLPAIRRQEQVPEDFNKHALLYVAPEHLRSDPLREFSQQGDIYSFAIILFELLARCEPYEEELADRQITAILDDIKLRGFQTRPKFPASGFNPDLQLLMTDCWKENPDKRPSIHKVRRTIKEKYKRASGRNILDTLLQRMEQYANNLEGLVDERTNAFLEEKRKADELLFEILPRSVADKLKNGQMVEPEAYEAVTIYFSDIVGFTNLSAVSTPLQVIDLLNDLYTCFDAIIDNFDVYKVETIGDAYMVVSGLPIRNGQDHVVQIARMSLSILTSLSTFQISHMPGTSLQARIGIHSAMKIHISESTRRYLSQAGNFVVQGRGEIEIKGKGSMLTHWLVSEAMTCGVHDAQTD